MLQATRDEEQGTNGKGQSAKSCGRSKSGSRNPLWLRVLSSSPPSHGMVGSRLGARTRILFDLHFSPLSVFSPLNSEAFRNLVVGGEIVEIEISVPTGLAMVRSRRQKNGGWTAEVARERSSKKLPPPYLKERISRESIIAGVQIPDLLVENSIRNFEGASQLSTRSFHTFEIAFASQSLSSQ